MSDITIPTQRAGYKGAMNMTINIESLIQQRRTIHEYSAEPVEEALILKALELALWAPNHRLTYPWYFTWVGPSTRQSIADLTVQLKSTTKDKEMSEALKQALRAKSLAAPVLIVVHMPKSPDPFVAQEDYASVAAGLQNAALYLWTHGLGSKWSTGAITRHTKIYEWCQIDPHQQEVVGFFWIGYPQTTPPIPTRPQLSAHLQKTP